MAEVLLPTWIIPEEETHEWLDEGSSVFGAAFAPGLVQRQSYGGLRLKLSRRHTVRGEEKAQLLSVLAKTRGRYNALRTKVHFALRGAIASSEIVANNTFASGTSGWGTQASAISVSDRILRMQSVPNAVDAPGVFRSLSVTQFVPYAIRAISYPVVAPGTTYGTFFEVPNYSASGSYRVTSRTPDEVVETFYPAVISDTFPDIVPSFIDTSWCSVSRCLLVDNGPNSLLRSDEFDNASWTKADATVSANALTAPDGTVTGDSLVETATTAAHFIQQSATKAAVAEDWVFSVAARIGADANARSFIQLQLTEASSANSCTCSFNLATGAVFGSVTNNGTFTKARAFIKSLANGWYQCSVVGHSPATTTTIFGRIVMSADGSTLTYLGSTTGDVGLWRATLAQSSVPTRLTQTTTAASTGTSQTGTELHVKGLDASPNGLLLPGDWFEINGELKQATAALNSDAAGLGYLQFEPALVRSPTNDSPVIVTDPMGKFLVSNIRVENQFGTQAIVTYDLEHIYE